MSRLTPTALALVLFSAAVCAAATPCVTETEGCLRDVRLGGDGHYSRVYSSYSLHEPNPSILRALIVVHGVNRNASDYFKTGVTAAFVGGRLEDTIVIAPRFAVSGEGTCNDKLAPGEISWSCRDSWKADGKARNVKGLDSFQLVDTILRLLADRKLFPNLAVAVVSGHSAGGQFVARLCRGHQGARLTSLRRAVCRRQPLQLPVFHGGPGFPPAPSVHP